MTENPPEWAAREFCRRLGENYTSFAAGRISSGIADAIRLGAELIAAHEEPPVDPLLVEARSLAIATFGAAYGMKDLDATLGVKCALAALKRGIELSHTQEGKSHE